MKFLLDVNASGIVARWLTNMGHDVAQVAEKDPRMRDEEVLTWAVNERRIIVTTDQDFEEMSGARGSLTVASCGWKTCPAPRERRCWKMCWHATARSWNPVPLSSP